jgi:crossover junction endodeoxyribonuclease RuvC
LIVLGIDPSSTSTGYGLLEYRPRQRRYLACGCIRPRSQQTFEDRLVYIYDHLKWIIGQYAPDAAAMESTFFGKDADAAAKLGQARGVLLLALRQAGLPIAHYTPAEVKKAVVGHGRASKEQVQFMVIKMLGLKEMPRPLDASDALAIALCHVSRPELTLPQGVAQRRPEVEALLRRMARR